MPQAHYSLSLRILTLLLGLLIQTAAYASDGLFFELKTERTTLYLLGSIHLANDDVYPLRSAIEEAFANSETLVVELDIERQDGHMMQRWLSTHALYPEGETVKEHLRAETYQRLESYLTSEQIPLSAVARQKPGFLATTLSSWRMIRSGLSPDQGIDLYFLQKARGSKTVLELETFEQQMNALLDLSDPDEVLLQTLDQLDDIETALDQIIGAWKEGNEQLLAKLLIENDPKQNTLSDSYQKLFVDRNYAMTERIKAYLNEGGSFFVVVGAGHLVGPESIPELLEQSGYNAERL